MIHVRARISSILVSVNFVIFKELPDVLIKAVISALVQTHRPLELNILDNSPNEKGRGEFLQTIRKLITTSKLAVDFSYTPSEKNIGFAKAHNILIDKSKGDFIVFLNADARLHPRYIARALTLFARNEKIAAIQPKIGKV